MTGLAFLAELAQIENPPKITVLVRSRAKLPSGTQARVVEGALDDEAVLASAMEGVDTVVSFLVRVVAGCTFSEAQANLRSREPTLR